jgi:hypothetical protein
LTTVKKHYRWFGFPVMIGVDDAAILTALIDRIY